MATVARRICRTGVTRRLRSPDARCRIIDDAPSGLPDRRDAGLGPCSTQRLRGPAGPRKLPGSNRNQSGGIMGNRALRTTVGLAWCCAMAAPRADAQLAPFLALQPGSRVRVQAPGVVTGPLEATVVTRSRDT